VRVVPFAACYKALLFASLLKPVYLFLTCLLLNAGTINLGRYYRKAYKRNMALKLFETKKGAAAKRAK
jgi:hypothetical protein